MVTDESQATATQSITKFISDAHSTQSEPRPRLRWCGMTRRWSLEIRSCRRSRPGEKGNNLSQRPQYAEKEALEIASLYGVELIDGSASNKVRDSLVSDGPRVVEHTAAH